MKTSTKCRLSAKKIKRMAFGIVNIGALPLLAVAMSMLAVTALHGQNPVPLVKGGVVAGTTAHPFDRDQFKFSGKIDRVFQLYLTQEATQAGYLATATLVAPSGAIEATFIADSGSAHQTVKLKEDGRYLLHVSDDDLKQTGKYRIGLEGISRVSPGAVWLTRGEIQAGSITGAMDKRQFVFRGRENEVVNLAIAPFGVSDADFFIQGFLYDSNGNQVAALDPNSLNYSERTVTLPKNGKYMLQIQDFYLLRQGDFKISLNSLTRPKMTAFSLPPHTVVQRTFSDPLEKKLFKVQLNEGEQFTVTLLATSSHPNYRPRFQYYDLTLREYSAPWDVGSHSFTARSTGKYLIIVSDTYYDQTGGFSLFWYK